VAAAGQEAAGELGRAQRRPRAACCT
jgi:hypothetical protein